MRFYYNFDASLNNLLDFNWDYELNSFLNHFIMNKSNSGVVKKIIDLRTDTFKLQAYGRVLRRSKDINIAKNGNSIRDTSKVIEDSIGKFLYYFEMFELASDKAKPQLEQAKSDVLLALFNFLDQIIVIRKNTNLLQFAMASLPKDFKILRKVYLKGVRKELKKIQTKICEEINPEYLEDGTHKLRRLIRWVIMYFIYPQGLFQFDKIPAGGASPFLNIQPQKSNLPVTLSYKELAALSLYVGQLGQQKDEGLFKHYTQEINGHKVNINLSDSKTIDRTKNIISKIKKDKFILNLRRQLKK